VPSGAEAEANSCRVFRGPGLPDCSRLFAILNCGLSFRPGPASFFCRAIKSLIS
jgi:hypothetical protein